jgi:hypothetical protein
MVSVGVSCWMRCCHGNGIVVVVVVAVGLVVCNDNKLLVQSRGSPAVDAEDMKVGSYKRIESAMRVDQL